MKKIRGVGLFFAIKTKIFDKLDLYLKTVISFYSCVETRIKIYQIKACTDSHILILLGNGTSLFEPKFLHSHHLPGV